MSDQIYRKGEVWLCEYAHDLEPLEILEITNGYVRCKYGWESGKDWHAMAKARIGTARRFLGIRIGITK